MTRLAPQPTTATTRITAAEVISPETSIGPSGSGRTSVARKLPSRNPKAHGTTFIRPIQPLALASCESWTISGMQPSFDGANRAASAPVSAITPNRPTTFCDHSATSPSERMINSPNLQAVITFALQNRSAR